MPTLTVLPHSVLCPSGARMEVTAGTTLCRALLDGGVAIEHACDQSCACTTCHVIVREGFNALAASTDEEDDLLDRAWGLTAQSRLSCQAQMPSTNVTVEIPRYTINHAREEH